MPDLAEHERAGGHTLARHVGLDLEALRKRLTKDAKLRAASTFPDRPTAERAVAAVLVANAEAIARWLLERRDRDERRLRLRHEFGEPVGTVLGRDGMANTSARRVLVVIQETRELPTGYVVRTAYPEL